jgi:hypothetical protein
VVDRRMLPWYSTSIVGRVRHTGVFGEARETDLIVAYSGPRTLTLAFCTLIKDITLLCGIGMEGQGLWDIRG